ncbi:NAD(P)-binding domain-containing protein [Kibdelosporangium philippinense]|uniref:NAD(P)-binding domain-containing protein n=1 Tax=Kibdelosporangium philippinense TaxID=211113 RepID=UPI0027E1F302|nr:NAD(P)-binding domain-containing protein [Kibdelosporangium philippinense]
MTVALLGTGTMGAGMARNIAKAGIPVRVWNRSREKAEPLADFATVTDTAAEAVAGADIVITMVFDANAVESVLKDIQFGPDAVWVQSSTVGSRRRIDWPSSTAGSSTRPCSAPSSPLRTANCWSSRPAPPS